MNFCENLTRFLSGFFKRKDLYSHGCLKIKMKSALTFEEWARFFQRMCDRVGIGLELPRKKFIELEKNDYTNRAGLGGIQINNFDHLRGTLATYFSVDHYDSIRPEYIRGGFLLTTMNVTYGRITRMRDIWY